MSRRRLTAYLAPRWWGCLSLLFAVTSGTAAPPATGQGTVSLRMANVEYRQVVAAYLINFIRYIEWPEGTPAPGQPWRIGILRVDGIAELLRTAVANKSIRGHTLEVVFAEDAAALIECQIILFPAPTDLRPNELTAFADRPIVTVAYRDSETSSPPTSIEMVLIGRNIRYRLNAPLLIQHGLKPTSGLLENALPPSDPMAGSTP